MYFIDLTIKEILHKKKWTTKKLCKKLNITESGFSYMMKNETIKVKTLLQISEILNVSINIFFDTETDINTEMLQVAEDRAYYGTEPEKCKELKKEIDYLKKLLSDKEKIIRLLEK